MISSFYIGAVVDMIDKPKLLEAGKYMAGGEFMLTKNNVYPVKTYETFEADPMDSLLSAYSKIMVDEKMDLQILISPLDEKQLKAVADAFEASNRLSKLNTTLLLLAKIENRQFPESISVSPQTLINKQLETLEDLIISKKINVVRQFD
ncbi:MAG: hypothetical protein WCJ39_09775, partial [bacterium]